MKHPGAGNSSVGRKLPFSPSHHKLTLTLCLSSGLGEKALRYQGQRLWRRWVTLSIFVGTESIEGFQLSSGIRAAQVSDIWIRGGHVHKGNVNRLINIAVRLQRVDYVSMPWCIKGNPFFCPGLASVFISNSIFILKYSDQCGHSNCVLPLCLPIFS